MAKTSARTMRGIGPCYRDKVGRSYAVRLGDMLRPDFREKIGRIVEAKRRILAGLSHSGANIDLDADAIFNEFHTYSERLRPYVGDTTAYLLDAVEAEKRVLFEGAQGALLDVDHGTYPVCHQQQCVRSWHFQRFRRSRPMAEYGHRRGEGV